MQQNYGYKFVPQGAPHLNSNTHMYAQCYYAQQLAHTLDSALGVDIGKTLFSQTQEPDMLIDTKQETIVITGSTAKCNQVLTNNAQPAS